MTSPTTLSLPAHITGNVPSGAPDTLRTVPPRVLAPSPTDPKATAHAIGAHVLRLPARLDTRAAKMDGTPVLFALDGKETHVFTDSVIGVVEVVGWSAEQVATIRQYFDAVDAPVSALDAAVDRLAATGASSLSPTDRSPEAREVQRLLGLSDAIDGNVDNGYLATRATLGDAREVDRLVALAAELDDGTSSGDAEVDRLARMADGLSEG